MSLIIRNLLSREITSIPTWIQEIFGEYYNNTLCNGATWMLFLWNAFHITYSHVLNVYLNQKIGMEPYRRTRVMNSLWLLGFYSSVLAYNVVALKKNSFYVLRDAQDSEEDVPLQTIVVHTFIITFYLHTALWQGFQHSSFHLFLKYFLLSAVCAAAYTMRLLDIPFVLSALVGFSTVCEEVTKLFYTASSDPNRSKNPFLTGLYISSVAVFAEIHLSIIPLLFLIPMGKILMSGPDSPILFLLFSLMVFWLTTALYNSILLNTFFHWLYHKGMSENEEGEEGDRRQMELNSKVRIRCPGYPIECSLFSERTDDAYILDMLRSEINERKRALVAKRKPRTRNLLMKTLKCMMTIKKKFAQRRSARNSNSAKAEDTRDLQNEDLKTFIDEDDLDEDDSQPGNSKVVSGSICDLQAEDSSVSLNSKEQSEQKSSKEAQEAIDSDEEFISPDNQLLERNTDISEVSQLKDVASGESIPGGCLDTKPDTESLEVDHENAF